MTKNMGTMEENNESTNLNSTLGKDEENTKNDQKNLTEEKTENSEEISLLDYVENSPAIFQSQQIGDPELTIIEKRKIAEDLLHKNPVKFLLKFGEYLKEEHLNYFLTKYENSYEVGHYVKNLKTLLSDHNKKILKRNRRFEAMKKLEAEGSYFSEVEMERREPLLYHQMVGQFLSEKEKLKKSREAQGDIIPTFSNFLIYKMERDELDEIVKSQEKQEMGLHQNEMSSGDESMDEANDHKRWGESWEDEPDLKVQEKPNQNQNKRLKVQVSAKEKDLLLKEFKSIMRNNFLNGKDSDFNYSEVDCNSDFDSIELRTQDEEEKYFDEEVYDDSVCTDTGIEDY